MKIKRCIYRIPPPYSYDYKVASANQQCFDDIILRIKQKFGYGTRTSSGDDTLDKSNSFKSSTCSSYTLTSSLSKHITKSSLSKKSYLKPHV